MTRKINALLSIAYANMNDYVESYVLESWGHNYTDTLDNAINGKRLKEFIQVCGFSDDEVKRIRQSIRDTN